jgi:hypothetical protein
MPSIGKVLDILRYWGREDLVRILDNSEINFEISDSYGKMAKFSRLTTVEIFSSIQNCERLRALLSNDQQLIIKAFLEIYPPRENDIEICDLKFVVNQEAPTAPEPAMKQLIKEIEAQRNLMIAVSTGGPRIQEVNHEYDNRRRQIQSNLSQLHIDDPNPYGTLWEWYGKWSSGDLPTYQSRRLYINELYNPLLDRLSKGTLIDETSLREPTGWARVDRCLDKVRIQLERSSTEEDFQSVGLLCRETLISLVQAVYDPKNHSTSDGTVPSKTDAKRMLEAFIEKELSGGSHEATRRHAKASLQLANDVQHRRDAQFRDAALCAEATSSVVNVIAIISGRRDPVN